MKLSIVDRNRMLSGELRRLLERRLSFALSRFDSRIRKTTVVLEDVNGPRGGMDKSCRIAVVLDRASYLEERGYAARVQALFPAWVSPRNLGIVAVAPER